MTFFSLIKPYRKKISYVLTCIFFSNLLALAFPWGIKVIVDDVLIQKNTNLLNVVIAILLVILILRSYFNFFKKYTSSVIGEKIVCRLREKIYHHIHQLSLGSIKKLTPSQMMTRMTGDLDSLRQFLFGDVIEVVYAIFSIGLIFMVLSFLNLKLTLISVLTFPLFIRIYFRLLPQLRANFTLFRNRWGQTTSRINEVLNGIMTVKAFTGEKHERHMLWDQQKELIQIASQTHSLNTRLWILVESSSSLGVLAILWIGGLDVLNGRMTAGELIAFYSYLGMLFSPLIRMVVVHGSYQEASAALDRINDILGIENEIQEVDNPIILSGIKGNVEFKNVSFGYSDKEDVLKDIHFRVDQGETVGIVGASGAGKTTMISLLLRFYDPRCGEILIDAQHLKKLELDAYRKQLAVVLQDDFLFSGSIEDNIRYGNFKASYDELIKVTELAHIYSFISQLPEGFKTEIGERGLNLSSGQRQRIAIARALLKNPSILILDEATSAVDALTENAIQKSIREFMQDKTVIIVAHRFSTIMEADKIIVLNEGKIIEMGPHDYLLKKQGYYSNLYQEQFRKSNNDLLANI